jgi:hypothetical protein
MIFLFIIYQNQSKPKDTSFIQKMKSFTPKKSMTSPTPPPIAPSTVPPTVPSIAPSTVPPTVPSTVPPTVPPIAPSTVPSTAPPEEPYFEPRKSDQVVGIATQHKLVGTGVAYGNLAYGSWCADKPASICDGEYRLAFSEYDVSGMTIKTERGLNQGLTDPDILFALTDIPASGITVTLQGRNIASNSNDTKWYNVDVPEQFIKPPQKTVKFTGRTGTLKKPGISNQVIGIATQHKLVGSDVAYGNLAYGAYCADKPASICDGEYRLAFPNGVVSDMTIKTERGLNQGLTDPDILFALTDIPESGITVTLQGRNIASNSNDTKWYNVDVPEQFIKPPQKTVKFTGRTGTLLYPPPSI